jgi:hypothetical protein
MNEEAPSPESQAAPGRAEPSSEQAGSQLPPPATHQQGGALPPWLPLAALAVVPAFIVGLVVYILASGSGSGGGGGAAGIIDSFLRLQPDANTQVERYRGRLPDGFPDNIPIYRGARPVVSFAITTPEGKNYFVILTTSAGEDQVFQYYRDAFDQDPWQVEVGQSSSEVLGLQFSRPDNPDVSGVITVRHSDLDNTTSIFLSYEDISAALAPGSGSVPFTVRPSRPLPSGFPSDIPIYEQSESVVMDTYFQRGQGGQVFAVTFLTRDSQDDVISFYREEFEKRGWTTNDTSPGGTSFAVSIDFADKDQTLSGEITADSFQEDAAYTRVDLLVQVTAGRPRGN